MEWNDFPKVEKGNRKSSQNSNCQLTGRFHGENNNKNDQINGFIVLEFIAK